MAGEVCDGYPPGISCDEASSPGTTVMVKSCETVKPSPEAVACSVRTVPTSAIDGCQPTATCVPYSGYQSGPPPAHGRYAPLTTGCCTTGPGPSVVTDSAIGAWSALEAWTTTCRHWPLR